MPTALSTVATVLVMAVPALLAAQEFTVTPLAQPRSRDSTYTLPLVPTRTVRFTTDEGTWMSVDVSPDGQTVLFDLLGDLYTVPIAGGKATRIMGGMALDVHPRYSPNGMQIVFVSDRSGAENLWIADANGRHPRPVLRRALDTVYSWAFAKYVQPVWTPDGRFIVVPGQMYDVATGAVMDIRELGGWGEVAFGGSERYAYVTTGSSSNDHYRMSVYDIGTASARQLFTSARPILRPVVSRDNHWLVYVTYVDQQTSLRLRNLHTGQEMWLARDVQPAEGRRSFHKGVFPHFAFTPDNQAIVVATGGKLWRIDVPSGRRTPLPFYADVELDLGPLAQFQYPITNNLMVRQIREPRLSLDGKRLAFIALDKLYLMEFPHGTPRRATTAVGVVENYPAWSPDGRYVAFSSYSDSAGGHIYRVEAARVLASGPRTKPERLTRKVDLYTRLAYSPDGRRLVFAWAPWREMHQTNYDYSPPMSIDFFWMKPDGGTPVHITHETWDDGAVMAPPQFLLADPDRLVMPEASALVSMRWDGSDRRTLLRWPVNRGESSIPAHAALSPGGRYAVVVSLGNLYLATLPPRPLDSLLIDVRATPPAVPLRRLSRHGAEFPAWSADGRQVYFALGRALFVYDVATGETRLRDSLRAAGIRNATDPLARQAEREAHVSLDTARTPLPTVYEPVRYDVNVVVARDRARGALVLRGARLITMKGDEVIARGDLVVRDGRIAALGAQGAVPIPRGARIIDVSGTTILPGYVDLHTHMLARFTAHSTQVPQYLAHLAYGVTTTRNPSGKTSDFLAYADRIESGDLLGPRVLSTGPIVSRQQQESLTSLAAVRELVQRYAEFYQTQTLKQYAAGNRMIRQWIVMAAHELGLSPTTEGAGEWHMTITELLDGYAGHEHNIEVYPLYRDVALLTAAAGITYTPTLIASFNAPSGKFGMVTKDNPHNEPKLRRFFDHEDLDGRTTRSEWHAEGQYVIADLARSAAKIVAAGGRVGIGAHGELHGLGTHWELWLLGSGGLSNLEVLRAGTLIGARAVGLDRDLGSLEPGKLADLQVLDGNPLTDLRQTNTLRYVMKSGRLYSANTLDELWPRQRQLGPQWWNLLEPPAEMGRASRSSQ